jgi:hypothetical protein
MNIEHLTESKVLGYLERLRVFPTYSSSTPIGDDVSA